MNIELTNLITPIINSYKLLEDEWENLFDLGIQEYIETQTEKYFYVNTFLHRHEKVKLLNVYYPIKSSYKELITDFDDLESVFEEYKYITIIGGAGGGKSTLTKFIFLNSLRRDYKIPIIIELRKLNEFEGEISQYLAEKILQNRIKPNKEILERSLKSGAFLFLLDGYDEIISDRRNKINNQLENFIDAYPNNRYMITTRPGGGIERFPRFYDFNIMQLSDGDVKSFVEKMISQSDRRERILKTIKNASGGKYLNYLRNPLLLSMFIMTYETHPEIPKRMTAFYRNVFDTLYSRHDGITKSGFAREKISGLLKHDFEQILMTISYLTYFSGEFNFTEERIIELLEFIKSKRNMEFKSHEVLIDLETAISVLIKDGQEFKFPHRSLQEFFCALFIRNLKDNQKKIIFEKYSSDGRRGFADDGFHFFEICEELDKASLYHYLLIPKLESCIAGISLNDEDLVRKFWTNVGGVVRPDYISFEHSKLLIWDTLRFFKIDEILFKTIREKHKAEKGFVRIYENEINRLSPRLKIIQRSTSDETSSIELMIAENWNTQFDKFFKKYNQTEDIRIGLKSINEKISELKKKIELDNTGIDELLRL